MAVELNTTRREKQDIVKLLNHGNTTLETVTKLNKKDRTIN